MNTEENSALGDVRVGRFKYSHNRFLMALLCLAIAAYLLADIFGVSLQPGMGALDKLRSHQMLWALLLVPVAVFGCLALKRSGHRDTAISCGIMAISFISACAFSVF